MGAIIKQIKVDANKGNNSTQIDLSGLSPGVYVLRDRLLITVCFILVLLTLYFTQKIAHRATIPYFLRLSKAKITSPKSDTY
ncbi:MAG: hypothetical protein ACI8P3_001095 [Saprospiraceae bacterium]|jgi:hypothetical protein